MALDAARVIWSEGLFLRPHHFQQLERYFENLLDNRFGAFGSARYGFLELRVDSALLLQGKVHLANAVGLFPDGSPFDLASETCAIAPFDVPDGTRDQVLYVNAVLRRTDVRAFSLSSEDPSMRRLRYAAVDATVVDNVANSAGEAELKVGVLNLSIGTQDALDGALTSLPVARVLERRADGGVVLDPKFVPPLLDIAAHPVASSWLDELYGIVKQRADALAARIGGPATRGVGEMADFWLLLLCNRYEPLLAQMRHTAPLHPLEFFNEMLKLAGECATYGRDDHRPPVFRAYSHTELSESMVPVIEEIRRAMVKVFDQTAVQIPLRDLGGKGVFQADIPDPRLVSDGYFVLSVFAEVTAERLRAAFLTQTKVGPTDKLRELVTINLEGIKLEAMQYPPRQIPFSPNRLYFQLDAKSPMWKPIQASRALALYVPPGDLPGLDLEMWAIRT